MKKYAILLGCLLVAFAFSLMSGKIWIGPEAWFAGGDLRWIFWELRLPRALLGLFIGGALGLSGAVLQGYLRNPLADPAIVGVSSTAALGGVLAIFLGSAGFLPGIFGSAMTGAMLAIILLYIMAGRGGGPLGFILGGIILSTLSGSLTAFLISIAPNPFASSEIISWLMGALTDRSMEDVRWSVPFMIAGAALLFACARGLDALSLGMDGARSIGLDMRRMQWMVIGGVGLCVGASVAVSGVVGFVGLIVPHVMRSVFGERPGAILIPSAISGAALLLFADGLVRLMPGAGEVRLGIMMAILGAPFFLIIMARKRGEF